MTLFDLLFLASLLFVLVCLIAILVSAARRRRDGLLRWCKLLGVFLVLHSLALIFTSLALPRRVYAPGERRCWDDWCATAVRATGIAPQAPPSAQPCSPAQNARLWYVEIEISSEAKRVSQRAPDARAELEDVQGARYSPCSAPLAQGTVPPHELSDRLNPGDSFSVLLPFTLPANRPPAGVVMHHGSFPGIVIIGDDSAFLHQPALQRLTTSSQTEVAVP